MSADLLLTEIQRQKKYTDALGDQFTFPLFNSQKALESQRRSGYRNTAAAGREIVDNAIEAGASKIHLVISRVPDRKKNERTDRVDSVAFIDNGSGMIPRMARFALSWGGGTHFEESEFIGKFGFGLPNASINQTRRVEVYSRVSADEPFMKSWLDINDYTGEGSVQSIPQPVSSELPSFVKRYVEKTGLDLSHGTVVVWCNPDRLTYKTGAALKAHFLDDFGVTYRYLLKGLELMIEGTRVEMVDPLFLEADGRYYVKPEKGGAQLIDSGPLPVLLTLNPVTGERHLRKVTKPEDLNDSNLVAAGAIHVRVARFPLGFVKGKKEEGGVPPLDDNSFTRFEIRKSRRGMSFVRAGREVETVDAFPRKASDVASGLGDWPLLQSYAYHWGIEVKFDPKLDEVFGITNDKQTVRPIEDFWRLLATENVDRLLHREEGWQRAERHKARKARQAATLQNEGDPASPAEMAAQAADVSVGEKPSVPDSKKPDANVAMEKKARYDAEKKQKSIEEARQALNESLKKRPYRIEYVDDENGPFYSPEWVGPQVVVKVNKWHPFFTTLYGSLLSMEGGKLAKEAADLLLIAMSRGELMTNHPETAEFYRAQRVDHWSPFLASAMRALDRSFPASEEEDEEAA